MQNAKIAKILAAAVVAAAAVAVATAAEFGKGNATAGEATYQSAGCLACHGVGGASVVPSQPILAGQSAHYLAQQLRLYKSGERANAVMATSVANIDEEDMDNLAAYLAAARPAIAGATKGDNIAVGEALYRHGNIERGLAACAACHGPAGAGIAPLYPRLGGQHAEYTAAALRAFAAGERPSPQMQIIAAELTEEEIKSLAAYLSGLSHR